MFSPVKTVVASGATETVPGVKPTTNVKQKEISVEVRLGQICNMVIFLVRLFPTPIEY